MGWKIILKFVASNPPSLLILAGVLGWLLCGFTDKPTFCNNWQSFVLIGTSLQLIWMGFKAMPKMK